MEFFVTVYGPSCRSNLYPLQQPFLMLAAIDRINLNTVTMTSKSPSTITSLPC